MPCSCRRSLMAWLVGGGVLPAGWAVGWAGPAGAVVAPLCGGAAAPAYPAAEQPALVQSWLQGGRQDGPAPSCRGLRGPDFELLVRVTASYSAPGDLDAQLARLGAVSRLKGASYWSFTDRKRQLLFKDAFALDKPGALKPRPDFSAAELRSGAELYFAHTDNRSSNLALFSLRLVQATPESVQVQIENLNDLNYLGLTLVAKSEMQWTVTIERLGPGRWGYRSLMGLRELHLGLAEQHRLSNLSRCVAMFDLLAGRQTEIEIYR